MFAFAFIGLVFQISEKSNQGTLSSFFELEKELKETRGELKDSQKQLLKTQRLATIGELAAWIGHDLRNPLTGIAGATYYLSRYKPKLDKKGAEMLETIERAIEHSNKIITDLIEYSKDIHLEPTETTPRSIFDESLLEAIVPSNIKINILTEDHLKIYVDNDELKKVFLSIIRNAIDAMPNGGQLTIRSTIRNNQFQISFADSGIGIPNEIIEKIWNPLFTTKAKGMGFGLPNCRRIIETHGGKISVESIIDQGTIFTVTLPNKGRCIKTQIPSIDILTSPI